jgi:competence protein ComEA
MRGWRGTGTPDGGVLDEVEPDEQVQRRFVRIVGLPPVPDDDPAAPAAVLAVPAGLLAAVDPRRRGARALALVAAVVVVVAATLAWWSRPRVEPVAAATEAASAPAAGPASPAVIVVAIAGRVVRPGLVRLPPGSRVADAIEAAGGVLPGTDMSYVNLARKLVDGELIVIGATPPPDQPGAGGQPAGPVNLNTATLAQLDTLPGVGPVLAGRIIDYRTKHGGFHSVSELRQVEGVGDARYEQLKDLVTV